MHDLLLAPFTEFAFMRRALAGALALSLSAPLVGVMLVLRRMSLMGDAMAHAILPGAAVGYLLAGLSLGAMTVGGLAAGVVVAVLGGLASRLTNLEEDAAMASFYLVSLALGVTLVSLRGSNLDLLHVLFGSVLALDDPTLLLLAIVATVTLLALAVLWRPLVMECVDPGFLASVSPLGGPAHLAFLGLVVLNLVAGFHALGTLLSVGIMILPASAARLWAEDVGELALLAVAFAAAGSIAGLLASYHLGLPAGPAVALMLGAITMVSLVLGRAGGLVRRLNLRPHLRA